MIEIPGTGEILCRPDFPLWKETAANNRKKLERISIGMNRDEWRRELIGTAGQYMRSIGLEAPEFIPGAPFVLSGHQPHPYHAGVMFKYRLLAEISKNAVNAVWVSADTEACGGFPVQIPSFLNGPRIATLRIHPSIADDFYEHSDIDSDSLNIFRESAVEHLRSIPNNMFGYGIKFLEEKTKSPQAKNMRDMMILWRRKYGADWPDSVFELPLSKVCETDGFFRFAFELLRQSAKTRELFNAALKTYRKKRGIRSRANPFPDLGENGNGVETLFWKVKSSHRVPLYVKHAENGLMLAFKGGTPVDSAEKLKEICVDNGIKIWPRAVALSLLQRLGLGDLFIHGVGGAKYDKITDTLIEELFETKPPEYAVASCTLPVPEQDDPSEKLAELHQKIREMQFHPEDFLEKTEEVAAIVEKKNELIKNIGAPGADKKNIGNEISQLNRRLNLPLEPAKEKIENEIGILDGKKREFEVIAYRELPYFLFPPNTIPLHTTKG